MRRLRSHRHPQPEAVRWRHILQNVLLAVAALCTLYLVLLAMTKTH